MSVSLIHLLIELRLKLEEVLFRQQQIELARQPESGAMQFINDFFPDNAVIG